MERNALWACLIVLLFVSAATLGEIQEDGTGTSADASATASKGNPNEQDDEEFYWNVWTTQAAWCDEPCEKSQHRGLPTAGVPKDDYAFTP